MAVALAILASAQACADYDQRSYEIEESHNDEIFVINGEKFESKVYCYNMEEGDRVIFLDGNANGTCVSATLLNLRTKQKCRVWCE